MPGWSIRLSVRLGGAQGCLAEVPELERSTALRHNGVDVNVSRGQLGESVAFAESAPHDPDVERVFVVTLPQWQEERRRRRARSPVAKAWSAKQAEALVGAERYRQPSGGRSGNVGNDERVDLEASAAAAARPDTTIQGK
jgi:hypothetical protein